jgi:hypothetical protein
VAHHEQGHAARRDPLTLLGLKLAAALFPIPGAGRLIGAWRQAAERACDGYAAARLGAPAGAALEQRVRALLDAGDTGRAPALRNDALAAALAALAGAIVSAAWPGDAAHHAAETILGWLVH